MNAPAQPTDEPASPPGDGGFVAAEPGTAAADGRAQPVRRLRLDLGYDGTDFSGWARQPGRRTVEEVLAAALARVLRLPEPPRLVVAGRTDAGVHATGQVVHADLPEVEPEPLVRRLAGVLPPDVVVRGVRIAPPGFDARFSAVGRTYRYRVTDAPADPLRRRDTLAWERPLDVDLMRQAGRRLEGEHDFAAFCRPRAGAGTVRTLRRLDVARPDPPERTVVVTVSADAFCHNQVRAMVGALLAVGDGRRPVHWPGQVLLSGVRDSGVTVAPPHGLTLVQVDYPPEDELGARAAQARTRRRPLG